MAKTTPVKINKWFFVLYGGILAAIMLSLGSLVFLIMSNFSFSGPQEDKFLALFDSRNEIALELADYNSDYQAEAAQLKNIPASDYLEREISLHKLTLLNNKIILKVDEMLDLDEEMQDLNLEGENYKKIIEIYNSDLEKSKLNSLHSDLLAAQTIVNTYFITDQETGQCLETIDYNQSNVGISNQINTCVKTIEIQIDTIPKNKLPITSKYLVLHKSFWSNNSELYLAIEQKDSGRADVLRGNIDRIKSELDNERTASTEEIRSFIQKEEDRIENFEKITD